jgi:hypothetical protein
MAEKPLLRSLRHPSHKNLNQRQTVNIYKANAKFTMKTPKHAATQFEFGAQVSIAVPGTTPKAIKGVLEPKRMSGTVRGWDQSNTHCLVQLENGETSYFHISALEVNEPVVKSQTN